MSYIRSLIEYQKYINLVKNGRFLKWVNGEPLWWDSYHATVQEQNDGSVGHSFARVVTDGSGEEAGIRTNDSTWYNYWFEVAKTQELAVTVVAKVRASSDSVKLHLSAGSEGAEVTHSGSGNWEVLWTTFVFDGSSGETELNVEVKVDPQSNSSQIVFDVAEVGLYIGYLPLSYQENPYDALLQVGGAGSYLDADFLDGLDSSQFLRSDVDDTMYANLTIVGNLYFNDSSTELGEGANNSLRIKTDKGYVDVGPQDTTYCYLSTDRSKFYFNKDIEVNDTVKIYGHDTYMTGGFLKVTGDAQINGTLMFNDANTKVFEGSGNSVRVQTDSGFVDVGPQSTDWCHFNTDRSKYYFNKPIHVVDRIQVYGSDTYLAGNYLKVSGDALVTGNMTINGNLSVLGATTTIDTQNLVIEDNEIVLNKNETGAGVSAGTAGIRIERGTLSDALIFFDETDDRWKIAIEGSWTKEIAWTDLANVADSTILNKLKNVDGSGTGLDADLLDGLQASQFLRSDVDDSFTGTLSWAKPSGDVLRFDSDFSYAKRITINDGQGNFNFTANWSGSNTHITDGGAARITLNVEGGDGSIQLRVSPYKTAGSAVFETYLQVKPGELLFNGNTVWHAGNDGAGSGLDADLLDGLQASQFLRSDTDGTLNGSLTITGNLIVNGTITGTLSGTASNADKLDGLDSSQFLRSDVDGTLSGNLTVTGTVTSGRDVYAQAGAKVLAYNDLTNVLDTTLLNKLKNVDGSGSGLDADLIRGLPGDFSRSFASAGYQKLPSGLIIQWGKGYVGSYSTATITFPVAFPNACLSVTLADTGTLPYGYTTIVVSVSATSFSVSNSLGVYGRYFYWISIGY